MASGIHRLPPAVRDWLRARWRANGWGDHQATTDALHQQLAAAGSDERPGMTTVWGWAKDDQAEHDAREEQRRLVAYATEARVAMMRSLPEADWPLLDKVGFDLDALIYEQVRSKYDAGEVPLDDVMKAHERLLASRRAAVERERADLAREKFEAAEAARRAAIEDAAERVGQAAEARGMGADEAGFWRDQVLRGL